MGITLPARGSSSAEHGQVNKRESPPRHTLWRALWIQERLCEGILGGVGQVSGLVISDVSDAKVLEDLIQSLAAVGEGHGAVVGITLLDQNMTVETAHVTDGEDTDAAEGTGLDGQDLTLGDIGAEIAFAVALQTVEGDGRGGNVAFQGATGDVRLAAVLQQPVLDQLELPEEKKSKKSPKK